ncbi:DUF2290 domain-containing protein [Cereibacter sphaeroides]|uniref:DUF2290 domain-containing protein n=1 Tax=Cereibacter sphaeroides TaxID=1063 RepID=UPI0009E2AA34|nr:DUF2290 domain-containing protein [Cereibacter sphaeroides]
MSATLFARNLDEFCARCLAAGIALNISSHVVQRIGKNRFSVKWAASHRRQFRRVIDLDLAEYLDCIRCNDFSLLLSDGGLIQVSSVFDADEVAESRFYYIPCPIRFEKSELEIDDQIYPLEDFINELDTQEIRDRMCIRAPFRFELDPANESDGHPLNHVHIGSSSSRIPVALSMCWDAFSRFIFKNFYPEQFHVVESLIRHPATYRPQSLTEADEYELHMNFRVAP